MCYQKAKDTNYKILEMAQKRMQDAIDSGKWDTEVFETMCKAIKNIDELNEIMGVHEESPATYQTKATHHTKAKSYGEQKTHEAKTTDSEFRKVIYDVINKKGDYESMVYITNVLDDYFKDIKVLQPRAYNNLIAKLKG